MKIGSHSFFVYTTPSPRFASSQLFTSFSQLFTSFSLFSPPSFASFFCFLLLYAFSFSLLGLLLLVWSYPPCLVFSSLFEKGGCWDNKRKRSHKRFAHGTLAEREGFALGPKGRFHKAGRLKEPPPWGETPRT